MPRKSTCIVDYIGRNTIDNTITLAIRGQRYEYFFRSPLPCETVEQLCRKGLARRALNYAKSRAWDVLKI